MKHCGRPAQKLGRGILSRQIKVLPCLCRAYAQGHPRGLGISAGGRQRRCIKNGQSKNLPANQATAAVMQALSTSSATVAGYNAQHGGSGLWMPARRTASSRASTHGWPGVLGYDAYWRKRGAGQMLVSGAGLLMVYVLCSWRASVLTFAACE